MKNRESKLETYLKDKIIRLGGLARKWVSPGYTGVPDQIVLLPSIIFFVEVKTANGVLKAHQTREHQRLRNLGAIVCVTYGEEGINLLVNDLEKFNKPLKNTYKG